MRKDTLLDDADGSDRQFGRVRAGRILGGSKKFGQADGSGAGDVPNEKNLSDPNNPLSKEDAALDRKIRSICRGC